MASIRFWSKGLGNTWKKATYNLYNGSDSIDSNEGRSTHQRFLNLFPQITENSTTLPVLLQQNLQIGFSHHANNPEKAADYDGGSKNLGAEIRKFHKVLTINNVPNDFASKQTLLKSMILTGLPHMPTSSCFISNSSSPFVSSSRSYSKDSSTNMNSGNEIKSEVHNKQQQQQQGSTEKPSVLDSMGIDRGQDSTEFTTETESKENEKKKEETDEQKNAESAFMKNQRYAKWFLLGSFGLLTPMFIMNNGSPKLDEFGQIIEDQYSASPIVVAYIKRAWGEVNMVKKDIVEPSSKKLLPDPVSEPYYQPPYTLVIELMDVFLRPVYDSVSGWRFKKRPGIDYFLSQVGPPLYEVVIFTRETGMTAFPLIESMDKKGYIMYRLFRDSARYKSGFSFGNPLEGEFPKLDPYYQKDLTYLNRDLSKVILVDCDKRAFEKQPENGLRLEAWDGMSDDTALYDLAGLLKTIATSDVDDVRPVLGHYAQNDKPLETFKLAQARMQEDSRLALRGGTTSQLLAGAGNTMSSLIRRR